MAKVLAAEGCSFMLRPAGRSGWVSTRATSCPAATMACSAAAANGGVPAKASLTAASFRAAARHACRAGSPRSCALAFLLLLARALEHLDPDAVALERAQVLDEHFADQMIHLVLHAHRGEPFDAALEG